MDISLVSWFPLVYKIFTAIQTVASVIVSLVLLPLNIFGFTLPGMITQILVIVAMIYIGYKLFEVAKNIFLIAAVIFIILLLLNTLAI